MRICLRQGEKTQNGCLVISGWVLSRKVWCVVRMGSFSQNSAILQTRMDQRGDHMKISLDYFQIQK